jgi:hypothetical protein
MQLYGPVHAVPNRIEEVAKKSEKKHGTKRWFDGTLWSACNLPFRVITSLAPSRMTKLHNKYVPVARF